MARMIPPIIGADPPPGERLIFQRLAEDPGCEGWLVLHSLHLAEVERAPEGEVDFVIVVPGLGVLCLEVKSHQSVERGQDGLWRLGGDAPTAKSPFMQAARGMHAILDFLRRGRTDLRQVPIWSAVWFTGAAARVPATPEWHSWQLLDRQDLRPPISQTLSTVLVRAREHFSRTFPRFDPASTEPSPQLAEAIAMQLRPRFELALTTKEISGERARERHAFLREQYEALDLMEQEERVLFTGAAGTGKSFLAVEAAQRAAARGLRTLFVCFNRLLASVLAPALSEPECVVAGTLHAFMLSRSGLQVPAEPTARWWQEELPDAALTELLAATDLFDVLVVDEIQDIACTAGYLDVLDAALRGGLAGGRWLMFGDFQRQMLYGVGDQGLENVAARCAHYSRAQLAHNCRNMPQIGAAAGRLARLRADAYKGYRRRDDGVRPVFRAYDTDGEQQSLLIAALDALKAEHYRSEEIIVLSPRAERSAAVRLADGPYARRIAEHGHHGKKLSYATIHAFKGLDAPAVIVTDITDVDGPAAESLLYVALSRATDRLFVLAERHAMTRLASLLMDGSANDD